MSLLSFMGLILIAIVLVGMFVIVTNSWDNKEDGLIWLVVLEVSVHG